MKNLNVNRILDGGYYVKTIIFDMYGVIIKESKGNFIPYTLNHFPESEHLRIINLIRKDKLFTRAGNGEITSDDFLTKLGYKDTEFHMRDYLENHLTLDVDFYAFAEKMKCTYDFALLSNDVSEWSRHITKHHRLDKYFSHKIISGNVRCRKPNAEIYKIALEQVGLPAEECIFIDNSVANLRAAAELGMDVILFNRDNETYDGKTVYSFEELLQVV